MVFSVWPWIAAPLITGSTVFTGGGVPAPTVAYRESAIEEAVPPPKSAGGFPAAE